jgi:aldose 1-epimerase
MKNLKFTFLFIILTGTLFTQIAYANISISKEKFGKVPDQKTLKAIEIYRYTISSDNITLKVTNLGATVQSIIVPDRNKNQTDVVLGYDNAEGYFNDINSVKTFFGSIPARFANRITNGAFQLNDKKYQLNLVINDQDNVLHPGPLVGLVWDHKIIRKKNKTGVEFSVTTPNTYWGFPGKLEVKIQYLLDNYGNMYIEYRAMSDKDTVINLTNHTYFNLNGQGNEQVTNHILKLYADNFTPCNSKEVPTGKIAPVNTSLNTAFDFRNWKKVGKDINDNKNPQIKYAWGYDINFILNNTFTQPKNSLPELKNNLKPAAKIYSPVTGIQMNLFTTQPGVQFYTGNHLPKTPPIIGKNGEKYSYRSGFAMETQHYPNSPNIPSFPTTTLKKGELFHQESVYNFTINK